MCRTRGYKSDQNKHELVEVAKLLIAAGADANAVTLSGGQNALHLMMWYEIIRKIIRNNHAYAQIVETLVQISLSSHIIMLTLIFSCNYTYYQSHSSSTIHETSHIVI